MIQGGDTSRSESTVTVCRPRDSRVALGRGRFRVGLGQRVLCGFMRSVATADPSGGGVSDRPLGVDFVLGHFQIVNIFGPSSERFRGGV